jgi:hypothetical protein
MPKKTVRTQATLESPLERSLTAYAIAAGAAAVGLLASASPADARVIFTPAHRRISRDQQINLDLNADGALDFRILIDLNCYTNCQSHLLLLNHNLGTGDVQWSDNRGNAAPLRRGQKIGPKKQFTSTTYVRMATFVTSSLRSSSTGTDIRGPWVNVKHRYLGLKFNIDGKTHYGWARLNVDVKKFTVRVPLVRVPHVFATLTGYAYETVPDKTIVAGDEGTGASLGHLALGTAAKSQP